MKFATLLLALSLGSPVFASTSVNNAFECFALEQNAEVSLFTRDLRSFRLVQGDETTVLKLNRKSISPAPARLVFENDGIVLNLKFNDENPNRAEGTLTGLTATELPVHWDCVRQLYGP